MLRFIVIDHLYFSPSITTNYRQNDLTSLAEKSIIMSVDSPVGQMVKTPPSQGGVMSSILVRVIYWDIAKLVRHRILVPGCLGSSPNIPIIRKAVALELQLFLYTKKDSRGNPFYLHTSLNDFLFGHLLSKCKHCSIS